MQLSVNSITNIALPGPLSLHRWLSETERMVDVRQNTPPLEELQTFIVFKITDLRSRACVCSILRLDFHNTHNIILARIIPVAM